MNTKFESLRNQLENIQLIHENLRKEARETIVSFMMETEDRTVRFMEPVEIILAKSYVEPYTAQLKEIKYNETYDTFNLFVYDEDNDEEVWEDFAETDLTYLDLVDIFVDNL